MIHRPCSAQNSNSSLLLLQLPTPCRPSVPGQTSKALPTLALKLPMTRILFLFTFLRWFPVLCRKLPLWWDPPVMWGHRHWWEWRTCCHVEANKETWGSQSDQQGSSGACWRSWSLIPLLTVSFISLFQTSIVCSQFCVWSRSPVLEISLQWRLPCQCQVQPVPRLRWLRMSEIGCYLRSLALWVRSSTLPSTLLIFIVCCLFYCLREMPIYCD